MAITLWIDADAAPQPVKEVCLRASERLALATILVANQRLPIPLGYAHVSAVRVDGGVALIRAEKSLDKIDLSGDEKLGANIIKQVLDYPLRYIAEHAVAGDVAITADIPLAALLVPKGVAVLDPRGEEYSAENIGERLSVRNFMDGLRTTGVDTGGHSAYGPREKQAFANALDRVLTRALRQR